jgi:hypothetical protein
MLVVLSLTIQTIVQFQRNYDAQARLIDTQYSARATGDLIARLIRNAQAIVPDPDGNGLLDSIRTTGDWNPPNGVTTDPYETVTITTGAGTAFKQEPSDAAPVPFSDRIQSITFTYFDTNTAAIANPVASAGQIAFVRIVVVTTADRGSPAMTLTTAAAVRVRE